MEKVHSRLRKLRAENETLAKEQKSLKQAQDQAASTSEDTFKKKVKSLTGELDLFEAFSESLFQLFIKLHGTKGQGKTELAKLRDNMQESVGYMRDICGKDSQLGIPTGKRVQRQVRYDRLKEEFLKLISKLSARQPSSERPQQAPSMGHQLDEAMKQER